MTIKRTTVELEGQGKGFEYTNDNNVTKLIDIATYEVKNDNSKQRANAILECYGGYTEYSQALQKSDYPTEVKKASDGKISLVKAHRDIHSGDIPLQVIPENSPLGKLKKAIANDDIDEETKGSGGITFTQDCRLSLVDIKQIKEDQKRVIRFAVKSKIKMPKSPPREGTVKVRTASEVADDAPLSDDKIREKCFIEKELPGSKLDDSNFGLMSSYITPLTLHLNQSGENAGKRADQSTRIYYTGFGYPVFKNRYCEEITGNIEKDDKKAELKAIFKQQIFAVLLARQQQINLGEITDPSLKVPLVLNRPFDFMKAGSLEGATALKDLVNESLCELFKEKDVADAMKGKIDQILIWDPPMDIYRRDENDQKIGNSLGQVKFFGDTQNFTKALKNAGNGDIEAFDMTGYDMISVARLYHEHKKIMLAIPGMVNPVFQDGEGAMIGLRATEESLNVASLGMMQIHLNSQHNLKLKTSPILDADNFAELEKEKGAGKNVIENNRDLARENTTPPPPNSTKTGDIPQKLEGQRNTDASLDSDCKKPNSDWVKPVVAGVVAGVAGAGVTALCASALGFGIVSVPVVATAVGVGLIAGGLTYIVTNHSSQKVVQENTIQL